MPSRLYPWLELLLWWAVWAWPFLFRAPHRQNRESLTVAGPTRAGLLLECLAILIAFLFRLPASHPPGLWRVAASMICGPIGGLLGWTSVTHLGRQFRVHAGLYHDHALVTTGPYAIVRHPIYASLLAMLLCTQFLLTPWPWIAVSLALFILGTEIRVRCEDGLLASRFAAAFETYRNAVPAYIPFVR
jgi:protein-S-isoprenylcysteine O-methyltransferase Ste14